MRKIIFRGKRLDNGMWANGFYLQGGYIPGANKENVKVRHIISDDFYYDVDPDTIGQFTGLFDKNGKEVYEGDIILWTRKNVHIEGRPLQDLSYMCVIYYDEVKCAFQFRCELQCGACVGCLDFDDDRASDSYIEVVGNVHDNPDLVEKGGEQ